MLANSLTGDDFIKGPRIPGNDAGLPLTDEEGYPTHPIGWTSWWGAEPRVCFPNNGTTLCSTVGNEDGNGFNEINIPETVALDPQIGYEQQLFLIAWTLVYLPANQKQKWLDMMRLWELGEDSDPEFENRIELHHPSGQTYIAKTYGKEVLFGRQVQKGIAARMLEYGNKLLEQAYVVEDGPDVDGDGVPEWYVPVMGDDGIPVIKYDSRIQATDTCSADDNSGCTCAANLACQELADYITLPAYLHEVYNQMGYGMPRARGIY